MKNTAMAGHDAEVEVARYITWPGQATAYKVGERFIRRLRDKAEEGLGDGFDPRDFYDVVLRCGPVPLSVLEELVEEYMESGSEKMVERVQDSGVEAVADDSEEGLMDVMTFANWCKCCVVPGTCEVK
mmetsp:Transcript_37271/g.52618  ORF Transcript_37271/g.52618 Transcript_37271/m.52618 type:complete len:128 (-) Transcript_37271:283-666(-)